MRMEREARGMVFLVGAGCGPADLITVRGLRLLEQCDAVVYDDLIDRELLLAAPEHVRRIYMGKRQGKHGASQEEICETLIRLAREGLRVVRLKGGDLTVCYTSEGVYLTGGAALAFVGTADISDI